jgi:hypothetical protein
VGEWRRRWVITLRWDHPANSPYQQDAHVFTVGAHELGEMIRKARADPHIIAFPYEDRWEREGDEPVACPNDHLFGGSSATRPLMDWAECPGCPGHVVYRCRAGSCPPVLDPGPGPYCRPRWAASARPARTR